MDVPAMPGTFVIVINFADCLMRWTSETCVSTPRRVLVPRNPRLSQASFLDPSQDAAIEALPGTGDPKCQPITGAECLKTRLDATHDARITE